MTQPFTFKPIERTPLPPPKLAPFFCWPFVSYRGSKVHKQITVGNYVFVKMWRMSWMRVRKIEAPVSVKAA